jgi:hypothetical protein
MERWRTTSIRLPRRLANAKLVNVFTGEGAEPLVHRGVPWLLVGCGVPAVTRRDALYATPT